MPKEKLLPVIEMAKSGDTHSKEFLCNKFRKLVHKLAWKYPHICHEDLVQEGYLAVLDAIDTYDPEKGASFFTWVYWKIRGRNTQASRKEKLNYSLDYQYLQCTLGEMLVDENSEIVIEDDNVPKFEMFDAIKVIRECTSTAKSYDMVSDRMGLNGGKPLDNWEVAEKYGVSKQASSNCMKRFRKQAKKKFPHLQEALSNGF